MARGHPHGDSPGGADARRARWTARWATGAAVGGMAVVAAWQATLNRRSPDAHWSVAAIIVALAVTTWAAGTGRQHDRSRAWAGGTCRAIAGWRRRPLSEVAGVAAWVVLGAVAIGWDLDSFAHQSHDLPTLSHFIGLATGTPVGRGLLFAAWVALGGYLALGWRRAR